MKILIALTLLTFAFPQTQTVPTDASGLKLVQLSFQKKWVELGRVSHGMVSTEPPELSPGLRVAGDVRSSSVWNTTVWISKGWVFDFRAEMKNDTSLPVTGFVWAYHPPLASIDLKDTADREYLCNVRIEPGETKLIKVRSPVPRPRVVDINVSDTPPPPLQPSVQDMIINQVRFANDTKWQRRDWNGTILLTRAKAKKVGKGKCIAL